VYKKVNKLSKTQAAYLAGILDGEGTITLTRRGKNANRQVAVTISNTEKTLIDYLIKTIGAGVVISKKTYKRHHLPSFAYQIHNRQALDLLDQLLPFLVGYKKDRATLLLRDYIKLTPRNGKYSFEIKKKREKFIKKFFEITQ